MFECPGNFANIHGANRVFSFDGEESCFFGGEELFVLRHRTIHGGADMSLMGYCWLVYGAIVE